MDSRARGRLIDWRKSGDPADQAAAMQEAIRYGKLDPKMVQLSAFLGHPAARLVGQDVKGGGIIVGGKFARNGDMSELAECFSYFGRPAILRMNLALVRMAFATRVRRSVRISPNVSENRYFYEEGKTLSGLRVIEFRTFNRSYYHQNIEQAGNMNVFEWFRLMTEATDGKKDSLKQLLSIHERTQAADRYYSFYNRWRPNTVASLALESICTRARNKVVKYCNGFYDDALMMRYIREEIYPWALGEFSEGVTTQEFVAHPPYVVNSSPDGR